MKIDTIIFDLDGTLLDTTDGIIESVTFTSKYLGYHELEDKTLLKFVGPPIQDSFMKYYGIGKKEAQKAAHIFRDFYKENALLKARPYDGIYELCDLLKEKGKRMAVATYKREDYALIILKYFGFDKYCISMHGADDNNILSKADIIELCINETGQNRNRTVLVGDTEYDATGAKAARIHFLPVLYGFGFHDKKEILYPNIGIAGSALEIGKYIE